MFGTQPHNLWFTQAGYVVARLMMVVGFGGIILGYGAHFFPDIPGADGIQRATEDENMVFQSGISIIMAIFLGVLVDISKSLSDKGAD